MLVSQSLKSLCTVLGSVVSKILSKLGIQLPAKWQFCKHTQSPLSIPLLSNFSALAPWPCPRLTLSNFLENFISSANFSKSAMGSAPELSTKMSGTKF